MLFLLNLILLYAEFTDISRVSDTSGQGSDQAADEGRAETCW